MSYDDINLPTRPQLDETWRDYAACKGIDTRLFFPERGDDTLAPKRICASCPVAEQCLDYAMTLNEKFGIWGGASERQRRALRRVRNVEIAPKPIPHGTSSGYGRGCRCRSCTEARAAYCYDLRKDAS
jgi:WhiB family redox-sensing transcriptional regulator